MSHPIYVYCYAKVSFDDAVALLEGDPRSLLQDATEVSVDRADTVLSMLHTHVGQFDVGRDVTIELGTFRPAELTRSLVPIRWKADKGHLWFPTMDATLEIAALSVSPPLVQVTLAGSYTPPLGPLGAVVDAIVAHRVAEAATHTFVNEVADRLERIAGRSGDALSGITAGA